MDLWYERLELAEEHHKDMLRDAHSWELLQEALKSGGKVVHPASELFSQLNQRAKQIHTDEMMQSAKEEPHV
jgi:hypothetical protein